MYAPTFLGAEEGKDANASACWMCAEEARIAPTAVNRASFLIIGCLLLLLWEEFEEQDMLTFAEER
jgi:hypothetical protein